MARLHARRFMAIVAMAALIGSALGIWSSDASTVGVARTGATSGSYCGSTACTSHTWLWLPAMRRGSR